MTRLTKFLAALLLTTTLFLTYKTFYQRLAAFGCFDQCFNFVAAYFMLKGKSLYSQIFFNHQPLMAYVSYLLQLFFNPQTLYHLVLHHRFFILVFSLLMDFLLIYRFRWAGIGFVFFYETTKYYLFGNFFLPEVMVAYLTAYLLGLWWEKFQKRPLLKIDYLIAGFFTWLIVFLRITYLPLALILYALILFPLSQKDKKAVFSLLLFLLFSSLILLNIPLKDYFHQVFIVNQGLISSELKTLGIEGFRIIKIFFYPFLILFTGKENYFRSVLIILDIVFLFLIIWRILKLKKFKETLIIFFLLGLGAIRLVEPGTVFYQAFHMLVWHSLFLMIIFSLLAEALRSKGGGTITAILSSFLIGLFFYLTLSPQSFLWEKVNRQEEFNINYAHYFAQGQVIKILSKPKDTLFLEMWDDLIYWQSGLDSSYPYSLYTPVMTNYPKYEGARLKMFQGQPPDFYYSYYGASEKCLPLVPDERKNDYLQLYFANEPSCLYLLKTKLSEIGDNQWQEIGKLGFSLPEITN